MVFPAMVVIFASLSAKQIQKNQSSSDRALRGVRDRVVRIIGSTATVPIPDPPPQMYDGIAGKLFHSAEVPPWVVVNTQHKDKDGSGSPERFLMISESLSERDVTLVQLQELCDRRLLQPAMFQLADGKTNLETTAAL
jgi:hypothetical protein